MDKVAFYIMNSKGWFVLSQFIDRFGAEKIAYVVSEKDANLQNDPYNKIHKLFLDKNIFYFTKEQFSTRKWKQSLKVISLQ